MTPPACHSRDRRVLRLLFAIRLTLSLSQTNQPFFFFLKMEEPEERMEATALGRADHSYNRSTA